MVYSLLVGLMEGAGTLTFRNTLVSNAHGAVCASVQVQPTTVQKDFVATISFVSSGFRNRTLVPASRLLGAC